MRNVFFIPPLHRMSGGLANIYAMALGLVSLGYEVAFTTPKSGEQRTVGLEETIAASARQIQLLSWEELSRHSGSNKETTVALLNSSDCWIVPESWPNALSVGINAGAHTVVYVQSWNFLLSTLPVGVRWKQLPVSFLAVSEPVAHILRNIHKVSVAGILPASIDPVFFTEQLEAVKNKTMHNNSDGKNQRVRIAWMPRKNNALAEQAQQTAEAILAHEPNPPLLEWVPIRGLSLADVAKVLSTCDCFLNTAFPEGLGLPPLEAMAMGCPVVGCTGFGGWEYMRQGLASVSDVPLASSTDANYQNQTCIAIDPLCIPASSPDFPLAAKPWGGNGFYCNDGDSLSMGIALATAALAVRDKSKSWQELRQNAIATASAYTRRAQIDRLAKLWPRLRNVSI